MIVYLYYFRLSKVKFIKVLVVKVFKGNFIYGFQKKKIKYFFYVIILLCFFVYMLYIFVELFKSFDFILIFYFLNWLYMYLYFIIVGQSDAFF